MVPSLALPGLVPLVAAHGTHDMAMESMTAENMTSSDSSETVLSYFALVEHSSLINAHNTAMTLAWAVILPIAVMLSIAGSRRTPFAQTLFFVTNAIGLFSGFLYNRQTPELYQHNVHHSMGWAAISIAMLWALLSKFKMPVANTIRTLRWQSQPMPECERLTSAETRRWSDESSRGPSASIASPGSTRHESMDSCHTLTGGASPQSELDDLHMEKGDLLSSDASRSVRLNSHSTISCILIGINVLRTVIERGLLPLGFAVCCTGIVVYSGIFRDGHVFGGLAHFIKGAIFLWYGFLVLGRWTGSFGDIGWAWNTLPSTDESRKRWSPSAEFAESALICFYGASNVFLERLGPAGEGGWRAQDLEHVGITILFFGGGLAGMIIESSSFRSALERLLHSSDDDLSTRRGISANPLPAIIIFLLGLMMSSHHQHSPTAAMLHGLWGKLFMAAAVARGFTYIMVWLKPPTTRLPSRPPTELVVAFCLIGGGALFMASNEDTVAALDKYEVDAMFVFTVGMGIDALLMAWTLVVLAIKGLATPVAQRRSSTAEGGAEC